MSENTQPEPGTGDVTTTPANTAQVTPTPPSTTSSDDLVREVETWKNRHAGLQTSLNKALQTNGWTGLDKLPKAADVEAWKTAAERVTQLQEQIQVLDSEKTTLSGNIADLTAKAESAERKAKVFVLVAEKYPTLVTMADYIPVKGTDEEQISEIDRFASRVTSGIPSRSSGPMPPSSQPSAGKADITPADLLGQMHKALEEKNDEKYNELRALWDQK